MVEAITPLKRVSVEVADATDLLEGVIGTNSPPATSSHARMMDAMSTPMANLSSGLIGTIFSIANPLVGEPYIMEVEEAKAYVSKVVQVELYTLEAKEAEAHALEEPKMKGWLETMQTEGCGLEAMQAKPYNSKLCKQKAASQEQCKHNST